MIGEDVFCLGLTRLQKQTLYCTFPRGFSFVETTAEDIDSEKDTEIFVSKAWCAFIDPKKLKPGQLFRILMAHKYATQTNHAAILLFTGPFTKEQKNSVKTESLLRVNLYHGADRVLQRVVRNLRKAIMPCWNGMARMRANMFNDGWYLVDIDTTGRDPLEDEVIAISYCYMANYQIKYEHSFYIQQTKPISERVEEKTGITNEQLENGITKEDAVSHLNELLPFTPFVFASSGYCLPFLKKLYISCGQRFDVPYIEMDGLAAITFGYTNFRKPLDILPHIRQRKYEPTYLDHPYLAKMYDLTLAVFENLQDRYDVRCPNDFYSLYSAKIECGE